MGISIADAAYVAGLFDGEGSVQYKQYWDSKRKDLLNKHGSDVREMVEKVELELKKKKKKK